MNDTSRHRDHRHLSSTDRPAFDASPPNRVRGPVSAGGTPTGPNAVTPASDGVSSVDRTCTNTPLN